MLIKLKIRKIEENCLVNFKNLLDVIKNLKDIEKTKWTLSNLEGGGSQNTEKIKKMIENSDSKIYLCSFNTFYDLFSYNDFIVWGNFIGFNLNNCQISDVMPSEDDLTNNLQIKNIKIEIRVVDSSFYEILSKDEELIKKIEEEFENNQWTIEKEIIK